MIYKTSELEGALLDAAVAKAEGWPQHDIESMMLNGPEGPDEARYLAASTSWALAGPIIEREGICLQSPDLVERELGSGMWWAGVPGRGIGRMLPSKTALIAAMRAYVSSKFGDEVDLPA